MIGVPPTIYCNSKNNKYLLENVSVNDFGCGVIEPQRTMMVMTFNRLSQYSS